MDEIAHQSADSGLERDLVCNLTFALTQLPVGLVVLDLVDYVADKSLGGGGLRNAPRIEWTVSRDGFGGFGCGTGDCHGTIE